MLFSLNDKETEAIGKEFDKLEKMLNFFDEIDTEGVKEMVRPFDTETIFLREDIPEAPLSPEQVLANAKETEAGMIVVPRVVRK